MKIIRYILTPLKWSIIGFLIFSFTSCNDKINVEFEFRFTHSDMVMRDSFTLEIDEFKDSCIYMYDNGKKGFDWVRLRFIINKRKGKLYYYFTDNPIAIKAKKTGEKTVLVKEKKQTICCYAVEDQGNLLDLFFTEEYGILLMKFDISEQVLIKFNNKVREIDSMINMIKEDEEFYKWGGREHFDPPPID